jgi:hypothetical protein
MRSNAIVFVGRPPEELITIVLQNAAYDFAMSMGDTPYHLLRWYRNLSPAQSCERVDGPAKNDSADSSPRNCTLAHATGLCGRVKVKPRPVQIGIGVPALLDCCDLTMEKRAFV